MLAPNCGLGLGMQQRFHARGNLIQRCWIRRGGQHGRARFQNQDNDCNDLAVFGDQPPPLSEEAIDAVAEALALSRAEIRGEITQVANELQVVREMVVEVRGQVTCLMALLGNGKTFGPAASEDVRKVRMRNKEVTTGE
jgi:hypothetical protein